jgi:hypothetical protein
MGRSNQTPIIPKVQIMAAKATLHVKEIEKFDPTNDEVDEWFEKFDRQCRIVGLVDDKDKIIELEKYFEGATLQWFRNLKMDYKNEIFLPLTAILVKDELKKAIPLLSSDATPDEDLVFDPDSDTDITTYFYKKSTALKKIYNTRQTPFPKFAKKILAGIPKDISKLVPACNDWNSLCHNLKLAYNRYKEQSEKNMMMVQQQSFMNIGAQSASIYNQQALRGDITPSAPEQNEMFVGKSQPYGAYYQQNTSNNKYQQNSSNNYQQNSSNNNYNQQMAYNRNQYRPPQGNKQQNNYNTSQNVNQGGGQPNNPYFGYICNYCSKPNHIARLCRKKMFDQPSRNQNRSTNNQQTPSNV